MRVPVGANGIGLVPGIPGCLDLRLDVGADRLGLHSGLEQGLRQRRKLQTTRGAFVRRFGACLIELLFRVGAFSCQSRLSLLESELACRARRLARFVRGRVNEPIDELLKRRRVDVRTSRERRGQGLASHVERDAQGLELGQRRLGRLRDERAQRGGRFSLRVAWEGLQGVIV